MTFSLDGTAGEELAGSNFPNPSSPLSRFSTVDNFSESEMVYRCSFETEWETRDNRLRQPSRREAQASNTFSSEGSLDRAVAIERQEVRWYGGGDGRRRTGGVRGFCPNTKDFDSGVFTVDDRK